MPLGGPGSAVHRSARAARCTASGTRTCRTLRLRLECGALLEQVAAAGGERLEFKAAHQGGRVVVFQARLARGDFTGGELLERPEAHRLELQGGVVEQRLAHADELDRRAAGADKAVAADQQRPVLAERGRKVAALV